MKLYYYPGSCALAPHIVLRELELDFELDKTDIFTKKTADGSDFLAVNPKGYVPALRLTDGTVLTEVSAVLQYIADTKQACELAPAAGTLDRVHLQEWLSFITAELHKGMGLLFNPDLHEQAREQIVAGLSLRLDYLDGVLAGQNYLMRQGFSIADAYAFSILNWSDMLGVDLEPWANIIAYRARIGARPRVREAMQAEGLLD